MKHPLHPALLLCSLVVSTASAGEPHEELHSDIHLLLPGGPAGSQGAIQTGAIFENEPGQPVQPGVRAWGVTLGESVEGYTDEPGYSAAAGTFEAFTSLGIEVLDVLRVWDSALQNFDAQAPTTMFIGLGSASVATPQVPPMPGDPPIGFHFALVLDNEEVHSHVNFFLNSPQETGVYLLKARIVANEPTFAPFPSPGGPSPSLPYYIVFNHNDTPENAETALQFVVDELLATPCPGDANASGAVDFDDLNLVLANWSTPGPGGGGDVNGSGAVDFDDLNLVLSVFGTECPE